MRKNTYFLHDNASTALLYPIFCIRNIDKRAFILAISERKRLVGYQAFANFY